MFSGTLPRIVNLQELIHEVSTWSEFFTNLLKLIIGMARKSGNSKEMVVVFRFRNFNKKVVIAWS